MKVDAPNPEVLRVLTAIRFTARELETINRVTYIFDPNWVPGVGTEPTIPLSIFYVQEQKEIMESELSSKKILMYNSENVVTKDSSTGGQTAVIADNIIIKPKVWNLKILVPFSATGVSNNISGVFNPYQITGILNYLSETGDKDTAKGRDGVISNKGSITTFNSIVSGLTVGIQAVTKILFPLIEALFSLDGDPTSFFKNFTTIPDYNKNSLEAMWRNRAILKIKMWNSWRYKYVVIKNLDLVKVGTVDGMYEGTLTVQEVPILTVRSKGGIKGFGWTNAIKEIAGKAIIQLADSFEVKQ